MWMRCIPHKREACVALYMIHSQYTRLARPVDTQYFLSSSFVYFLYLHSGFVEHKEPPQPSSPSAFGIDSPSLDP